MLACYLPARGTAQHQWRRKPSARPPRPRQELRLAPRRQAPVHRLTHRHWQLPRRSMIAHLPNPPEPAQAGSMRTMSASSSSPPATRDTTPAATTAATGMSLKPIMTGLVLVILLGALEQTIVAVALPVIANDLQGFRLMAWVVSAYLVASTVVTPIYGKLSDIYGRRNTMTSAVIIFLLASIGCAVAQSMPQLILFRILQGLGGGGLISVAQATIADVVPLRERGRYQGYVSGVWAVASMAGPVIGGYLTHYLSWRWIFWINLPLGLIAITVIRRALRALPVPGVRRRIDFVGAALFAVGLTGMLLAVTRIGQGTRLDAPDNLLLIGGAAVILLIFGWHENRMSEPIIPLRMFKSRTVSVCCLTLFIAFFQLISMSVLLPLRLQMVAGVAADLAAVRLLPLTLSIPFGAFLAGRMMTRSGRYKPLQLGGATAASLATLGLALTQPHQALQMAAVMCILGMGIGFQFPTGLVATQNAVLPQEIGLATALTSFSRLLGGAVGVAVLTSVLIAALQAAIPSASLATPGAGGSSDLLMQLFRSVMASAGDTNGVSLRDLAETAFRHLFLISGGISVLSPLLILTLEERELRNSAPPLRKVG